MGNGAAFKGLGASAVVVVLASACPGDDVSAGSGTGGDEDMPDGTDPGPAGPGCVQQVGEPPGWSPGDMAGVSQPAIIDRVVELAGEPAPSTVTSSTTGQGNASAPLPLTADRTPMGATTKGPHIHERWGESRKLELSYCINFMPGEDAELEASYHKTIRALNSTMAEWERVTGANFVHIVEDDTPEQAPHFT